MIQHVRDARPERPQGSQRLERIHHNHRGGGGLEPVEHVEVCASVLRQSVLDCVRSALEVRGVQGPGTRVPATHFMKTE